MHLCVTVAFGIALAFPAHAGLQDGSSRTDSPPVVPEHWLVAPTSGTSEAWRVAAPYILDSTVAPSASGPEEDPPVRWTRRGRGSLPATPCAYATLQSCTEEIRMADLQGGVALFVNGEGFVGDPARYGFRGVPVLLREGENRILVVDAQEGFELRLWKPTTGPVVAVWDVRWPETATLSDDISYPVFNATLQTHHRLGISYGHAVCESRGCEPRITDHCSGPCVAPLGLCLASHCIVCGGSECPDFNWPFDSAAVPVSVQLGGGHESGRQVLRHAGNEHGMVERERRETERNASRVTGSLFSGFAEAPVLVFGTHGTDEENRSYLARARFDQMLLWYRAGVVLEQMTDDEARVGLLKYQDKRYMDPDARKMTGKNLVLYGREGTNSAYDVAVPKDHPFGLRTGQVSTPDGIVEGSNLAGWFITRQAASLRKVYVAVVGGTGPLGERAGYLLRPVTDEIDFSDHGFWRVSSTGGLEPLGR